MSRRVSIGLAVLTALTNAALAGAGDYAGGASDPWKRATPFESVQYDAGDDGDYCWYDQGWRGPGWYVCGEAWDGGLGWGGPYGWNGWGGHGRRHHLRAGAPSPLPGVRPLAGYRTPGRRLVGARFVHAPSTGFHARFASRAHEADVGFRPASPHLGNSGAARVVHGYAAPPPAAHVYNAPVIHAYSPTVHSFGAPSALHGSGFVAPAVHGFAATPSPGAGGAGASFPSAAHGMGH